MNKQALRDEYKALRKALSPDQLNEQSKLICTSVIKLISQQNLKNIHLFLPIGKNKEVNTWPLYHSLIISEKRTVVLSKTHWESKSLSHHRMTAGDQLEESGLGIPEPVHDRIFDINELDLVLVPLLSFDLKGHRIGYGAGFYDRFLSQCPSKTLKVGLSLVPPLASELIPTDDHDIALDLCITPDQVYDFRKA